jgi:hypothetical protein
MNAPHHRTHAQELRKLLDRIHELEHQLRHRSYLHPMNLQANVENIQILLPADVHIVIGKQGVYLADHTLDFAISCQPHDMPAAIEIKRFLDTQLAERTPANE